MATTYAGTRFIHDADSHIVEPPGYYDPFLPAEVRDRLTARAPKLPDGVDADRIEAWQDDPERRAAIDANVMATRGVLAGGAYRSADRTHALDLLGFASQLVFPSSYLMTLLWAERQGDDDLAFAVARAYNRAMVEFCADDPRLLPVLYAPLCSIDGAAVIAGEAIAAGAAALMVASDPPLDHSPSHIGLDPVWRQAEEAGIPVVFHIGGGTAMNPVYNKNGLPPVPDFHGGDGNLTSVSFMAVPYGPMQTLATLILDGVLDRFGALKVGVIEQGAAWVSFWMQMMDAAAHGFRKNETRLQQLSLKPSEFVRRQVRITPYPHEPVGDLIEQVGAEVLLFSSDYPHVEGGQDPVGRFDATLVGRTSDEIDAFYRGNMADLIGPRIER